MSGVIPILVAHDHRSVAGVMVMEDGRLKVVLSLPITREQLFEVFGNCGIRATEQSLIDGVQMIAEFEILEFSL